MRESWGDSRAKVPEALRPELADCMWFLLRSCA